MGLIIYPSRTFVKQVKRLAKKYRSIVQDLQRLEEELKANPLAGTDLGHNLRKVRMSITAKGKGKSGGARVITHTAIVSVEEGEITLLTIYDKSERGNLSDKELMDLVAEL